VGVLASAIVQQALSGQTVTRLIPRRPLAAVLLGSVSGLIVPVCDCGAVPLARRMAAKGVPVYAALSFLLAAPIVNPVVLVSTGFAFQGNAAVVVSRMLMALSVAVGVGLLASVVLPATALHLSDRSPAGERDWDDTGAPRPPDRHWLTALGEQASIEFFEILFFIVLGALFTAATQTFVPRGDLAIVGARPVLSVLVLMPVASVLSICSEADAFVARAFATSFSPGAVLAFMTIGQIVDLRNGALLLRWFGPRVLALVLGVGYAVVLLEGIGLNVLVGAPSP
jgi:uncharacterized membrane protein YraQ (UPF0718 family)